MIKSLRKHLIILKLAISALVFHGGVAAKSW